MNALLTRRSRPRSLALIGLLSAAAASAQEAPTPTPSSSSGNTSAPIELAPFEVSSSANTGYQTNETLAGSRLRTSLADTASSLNIFTTELLSDMNANNEMDVMRYSSAAEQNRTDQTAAVQDIQPLMGQFNFRIRGQTATRAVNYFETNIIPDNFDTQTVEEARGPNAILFGSGAAGGVYNTSTKKPIIGTDTQTFGVVLSSDQDVRATADINRSLSDKLAVRVNALDEHGQGWQPYADSDNRGVAFAAMYRPTEKISISLDSIYEDVSQPMTRDFAPFDNVSLWKKSGSPEVAAGQLTATAAQIAQGIGNRAAGTDDVTFVGNSGAFHNFQGTAISLPSSPTANAANTTLFPTLWYSVDPSDPYPQNANFSGPGARITNDQGGYQLAVDLEPVNHLYLEFASAFDARVNHVYDWVAGQGGGSTSFNAVFGEPGMTYRDGAVNPYAGDYYIDGRWVLRDSHPSSTRYRLTSAYEFDLGKYFGAHTVAALLSRDFTSTPATTEFLGLQGAPFNVSPFAPANLIYVREYITKPSNLYNWAVPNWQSIVNRPVAVALNAGAAPSNYQAAWIDDANSDPQQIERSGMVSLQDHFWNDHIVTTLGYRRTLFSGWNSPTNFTSSGNDAGSYGVVVKATSWVSAFYNFSENAVAPNSVQLVIPSNDLFPLNTGQGNDYGLMFKLLGGKIFLRLGYYNTTSLNQSGTAGVGVNVVTRNQNIVSAMTAAGLAVPAGVTAIQGGDFDLSDVATKGYELNATANLSEHWRLMFNATDSESLSTGLLKLTTALQPTFLPVWNTPAAQNLVTASGNTVAQEIALYKIWYASGTAADGHSTVGNSKIQTRLYTRYDFSEGWLKGFYVGGGYIYSSSLLIGYSTTTEQPFYSQGQREADALLGYTMRLPGRLKHCRLNFQLNAMNILDRNRIQPIDAQGDGQIIRAIVLAPTSWAFGTKITF